MLSKFAQNAESCDHFVQDWRVYGGEPAAVCKWYGDDGLDTCNSEDAVREIKLIKSIEEL